MNKNLVVILENNENWAKRTAANLPKKLRDTTSFLFIIEDRIGTTHSMINKIFKNKFDYSIITSSEIIEYWDKTHTKSDFMHEDTLSSNILGLWYIKEKYPDVEKVLLLDDDIIIHNNFEDVFNSDICLFYRSIFPNEMPKDFMMAKPIYKQYWNEFFKVFNWKYSENDWLAVRKKYVCTGTRMIVLNKIDFKYYEQSLINFYNSDVFRTVWANRDKCRGRAWFMTEIFENVVWRDLLNNELSKQKLCYTYFAKAEKFKDSFISKHSELPILHIACGNGKVGMYNKLLELKCIK